MALNSEPIVQPSFKQFMENGKRDNQSYTEGDLPSFQYKEYPHPFQQLPKYIAKLPSGQTFDVSKLTQIGIYTVRQQLQSLYDKTQQYFYGEPEVTSVR